MVAGGGREGERRKREYAYQNATVINAKNEYNITKKSRIRERKVRPLLVSDSLVNETDRLGGKEKEERERESASEEQLSACGECHFPLFRLSHTRTRPKMNTAETVLFLCCATHFLQ